MLAIRVRFGYRLESSGADMDSRKCALDGFMPCGWFSKVWSKRFPWRLSIIFDCSRINYFVFPGMTDSVAEYEALRKVIRETGLKMIQWRNFNIDPD